MSTELRPTAAQWVAGARPRTLPAAVAPVLAGCAIAVFVGELSLLRAALCLVVGLALQIGVNYANDYSDGVRGTDAERVGPLRLVGSGLAEPRRVKAAAFGCFGVAALAGAALVVLSGHWWLLGVGAAAILAAWFYTGGPRPYGYHGLGEVFVFVFFGLVAVGGTIYVQLDGLPPAGWITAAAIGLLACALLVANNLRDLVGDAAVGKQTLATRLGDRGTRLLYAGLIVLPGLLLIVVAAGTSWFGLLALAGIGSALPAGRAVLGGARGPALIPVLQRTGLAELITALGLLTGLWLGALLG